MLLNAVNIHCEPSRNIPAYVVPVDLRQMILLLYILPNHMGFLAMLCFVVKDPRLVMHCSQQDSFYFVLD